jgi:hypothetical protein
LTIKPGLPNIEIRLKPNMKARGGSSRSRNRLCSDSWLSQTKSERYLKRNFLAFSQGVMRTRGRVRQKYHLLRTR